jgi:cellobiose transport system substrate-binding protein
MLPKSGRMPHIATWKGSLRMGVTLRRRAFAAVALSASVALAISACGKDSGSSDSNKKITLQVMVFGTFGMDDLYKQYEASHPNITIKEVGTGQGLDDENNKLSAALAAGTAPADVVALEEGTITSYKAQAQNFVDYMQYDGASLKPNFLPWKWDEGSTNDGKVIGLGTDVGSLAMCYRTDLFQAAGLPTDRDAVSKLWPTWDDYIKAGQQFNTGNKNSKVKFLDSATNVYNAILMQNAGKGTGYTYFDKSDKLVIDQNPDIKAAFTTTTNMITNKLSAGLQSFSKDWETGFKNGSFATIACPAWMLGVIKTDAGDSASGKWDVAKVPGDGGNWGGSFLSVPSKGKHVKEAVDLAKFLTKPDSQLAIFQKVNNLPSAQTVYDNADFQAFKNPYFSNAPVGQIFGAGAKSLQPVYLGAKNQPVRNAVEDALRSVEQGKKTADAAWQDAIKNGTTAAK